MRGKAVIGFVLFLAMMLLLLPLPVKAATANDFSTQLICQCGCTLVLNNCTHVECHSRSDMINAIKVNLEQGKSEEQIIALFVTQYGEQVLASPPKRGFNLMAWILPFAAILAGGVIIYISLRRWVRQGHQLQTSTTAESDEGNEEYERRLEQDLKEFRERGFR